MLYYPGKFSSGTRLVLPTYKNAIYILFLFTTDTKTCIYIARTVIFKHIYYYKNLIFRLVNYNYI